MKKIKNLCASLVLMGSIFMMSDKVYAVTVYCSCYFDFSSSNPFIWIPTTTDCPSFATNYNSKIYCSWAMPTEPSTGMKVGESLCTVVETSSFPYQTDSEKEESKCYGGGGSQQVSCVPSIMAENVYKNPYHSGVDEIDDGCSLSWY